MQMFIATLFIWPNNKEAIVQQIIDSKQCNAHAKGSYSADEEHRIT